MELSKGCGYVLSALERSGFEAYAVGGCVRNYLLGIKPKDYDVATSALPDDILRVFDGFKSITNGIKHGTVTVVVDGEQVEVTTFRADGEYKDCRHPNAVHLGVSLKEDLSRRDFTVNAIAYSPKSGIIDPFGGAEDIKRRVLRCVGEPDKRFSEDALRIMRALRFSAQYSFEIDCDTARSIHENKGLLKKIAVERIFTELSLLLCGDFAGKILCEYSDVFSVFIPQLEACNTLFLTGENHRQSLLEHIARSVDAVSPSLDLRLAMLLHDIAKPLCIVQGKDGQQIFPNHGEKSAELAGEILKRLRAPAELTKKVCLLCKYHDVHCETEIEIKRLMRDIGSETVLKILSEVRRADILAQNGCDKEKRLKRLSHSARLCRELIDNHACVSLKQLKISGDDLLSLGYSRGIALGQALSLLLDEVIEGKLVNDKDSLIIRSKELIGKINSAKP